MSRKDNFTLNNIINEEIFGFFLLLLPESNLKSTGREREKEEGGEREREERREAEGIGKKGGT